MKANEASDFPKKVYIPRDLEYPQLPDTWWERESSESNIEYTRTDAFIEKACEWLENHNNYQRVLNNGRGVSFDMTQCVVDFRKAMKGE